jgi:hypothetical protein
MWQKLKGTECIQTAKDYFCDLILGSKGALKRQYAAALNLCRLRTCCKANDSMVVIGALWQLENVFKFKLLCDVVRRGSAAGLR